MDDEEYVRLAVGKVDLTRTMKLAEGIKIDAHQIKIHGKYNDNPIMHDIARITLEKPIEKYTVHPLPVVGKDHILNNFKLEILTLYGYAQKQFPHHLRRCEVKYISGKTAKEEFYMNDSQFNEKHLMGTWPTDGSTNLAHSFFGDSGSPVLNKDKHVVAMLVGGDNEKPDWIEPITINYDFIHGISDE